MQLIFGLLFMAVIAIAFFVFRAIARSPKLDRLFNFTKRDDTADDIFHRQDEAERDLTVRGRTLDERQSQISVELNKIYKKKKNDNS